MLRIFDYMYIYIYTYIYIYVTFGDYICGSGGLIDSSPALGVVYVVSVWSPW